MTQTDYQLFPRAILSVSREELNQIPLTITKACGVEATTLPADLQGHFFLIAPVGTVDSYHRDKTSPVVFPSIDGWTPLFNGDGMVYRVDFANGATLTTRIIKPPCYYADQISYEEANFADLRFRNVGYGRFSLVKGTSANIGVRNQLNTAFVPFQFSTDTQQRLLVTWDTGRPFEIDPHTLEAIAPLGNNDEWKPMLPILGNVPFPQLLTTAHPGFDPQGGQQHGGEFFTVNVQKSISTLLNLSHSAQPRLEETIAKVKPSSFRSRLKILKLLLDVFLFIEKLVTWVINLFLKRGDSVHLLRWTGKAEELKSGTGKTFESWQVVDEKGLPLKIQQTLHQMGITKDYIVLADTAFKFDMGEALPFLHDDIADHIEALSNDLLDYPQLPYTDLYIVHRSDLVSNTNSVNARHVRIDFPMAHYLVDYDNPDGKIVLHAAHNCATDPAETLHNTDQSIYNDLGLTATLRELAGSVAGPTDVSRLGCHVIDVEKATVESYTAHDINCTWSTAFYAYQNQQQMGQFEDIYWNSWGCWTDILSRHVFNLYKNYEQRIVPLGDPDDAVKDVPTLLSLTSQGIPSTIVRVHINRAKNGIPTGIELKDSYQFPRGYLGTSMQFVPKANATGSRAGYLICIVLKSDEVNGDKNEIWIFDAEKENLGGEPICRLTHPAMNVGFTLHTTWMAPRSPQPAPSSTYDVRQDYQPRLQNWLAQELKNGTISPEIANTIENLFEEVYKRWRDAHTVGH